MTKEKRSAEADRREIEELTRRVEKLEKEYVYLLCEIKNIHESDLEWGMIFQDLFTKIANLGDTSVEK